MWAPRSSAHPACGQYRGQWSVAVSRRHGPRRGVVQTRAESVTGQYYEDVVDQLAQRTISRASSLHTSQRYIVGIAGPPGAGKSTIVQSVADRINQLRNDAAATVVPMDGFHLYKHELDAMHDPKEAYARRGAHWTFDADKFVQCVKAVKTQSEVLVPSFDHGVGDPVPDDIRVERKHRVVLVEGNYLLLDVDPWSELVGLFDDTWFLDLPLDVSMFRVFSRQTSIGLSPAESKKRINYNDFPNAELIMESKGRAEVVVPADLPFRH